MCKEVKLSIILFIQIVVTFTTGATYKSQDSPIKDQHNQIFVYQKEIKQVETTADLFIEKFHQSMNFESLFREMFVADSVNYLTKDIQLHNLVHKDVLAKTDEATLKKLYIGYMSNYYLCLLYAFSKAPEISYGEYSYLLPEVLSIIKKSKFGMTLMLEHKNDVPPISNNKELNQFIAELSEISNIYKKNIPQNHFRSSVYQSRLKVAGFSSLQSPTIMDNPETFGIPKNRIVYRLNRDIFIFFFVNENGRMKIIQMGMSD